MTYAKTITIQFNHDAARLASKSISVGLRLGAAASFREDEKMSEQEQMEVISSYSRAQAIEDGVLINVSETAKEAGFKFPTVVTQNLWSTHIRPSDRAKKFGQDDKGRLWDVLWMAFLAAKRSQGGDLVEFDVIFQNGPGSKWRDTVRLWGHCGPGDDAAPVLTIMLPEDY